MISDAERREVARRLRGLDERIDGVPLLCTKQEHDAMALCAIRAVVGKGDVFHLLADLIDRPTCRNLSPKPADVLLCSECGEHVDIAHMETCDEYHARYCPRCGRKVVGNGED